MKRLYVLLVLLLLLAGCEKDQLVELTYPSNYRSVRYENVSNVRLFTKGGEITSKTVISYFIKRYGRDRIGNLCLYATGISILPEQLPWNPFDSIQLMSSSLAGVKLGNRFEEYRLSIAGNTIEFTSVDTALFFIPNIEDSYVKINIGVHKPSYIKEYRFTPTPDVPYKGIYEGFKKKYASTTPNQLVFPLINYVIAHTDNTPYFTSQAQFFSNYNDSFDQAAYKQLGEKDTLAVQEFRVIYQK